MEWMASVGEIWLTTLKWLAGLAAAFFVLTRLTPCNPGMYWWRSVRGLITDAFYWFIMPLFLSQARIYMLAIGIAVSEIRARGRQVDESYHGGAAIRGRS